MRVVLMVQLCSISPWDRRNFKYYDISVLIMMNTP